ncbi:hypothetical protein B0O99DRAFT_619048 [Bisporella sp. PMI_857]|nr:hypothetical protein B0O99DRAFT_619048 [Bisporella sp. PMI_857]
MATLAQLAEKARQDQPRSPSPSSSLQPPPRHQRPPPLPPRNPSSQSHAPPPYSEDDARRSRLISQQWQSNDPRSSSTHSLRPAESAQDGRDGRRTLLLIYIHGFMGNETSFQSFPAHVHNLCTISLAETHVVHTKIYPRYKSRKAIDFARDDFSHWLEPHENKNTDIVLLGHSMGGILAAEVALLPPRSPAAGKPFRHQILGTISFDTPFLGMHPGVVVSGIGSLFRPAPDPPGSNQHNAANGEINPLVPNTLSASSSGYASSSHSSIAPSEVSLPLSTLSSSISPLSSPSANDPYFNPPFPNDVRITERKGWANFLHFVNKHSDGLTSATKQYFVSHLEFGGCLADYPGLKNRYGKLRSLEDVKPQTHTGPGYQPPTRRVRFTNYYTASTGRPKAPKSPKIPPGQMLDRDGNLRPTEVEMQDMTLSPNRGHSPIATPRISVGEHRDGVVTPKKLEDAPEGSPVEAQMQHLGESSGIRNGMQEPPELQHIDSIPIGDDEPYIAPVQTTNSPGGDPPTDEIQRQLSEALPPIPPMPAEPAPIDPSIYTDKDDRKIAEKEYKRVTKAYQQAIKDRENAIRDREKVVEKREKKSRQEQEKQLKALEKLRLREEKEGEKRRATVNPEPRERQSSVAAAAEESKPKRDKKFCMLPPETNGRRDKCWVRVYMEGVDEVGAHCGLFFPGPQYESLVGDVGARLEQWVRDDALSRGGEDER